MGERRVQLIRKYYPLHDEPSQPTDQPPLPSRATHPLMHRYLFVYPLWRGRKRERDRKKSLELSGSLSPPLPSCALSFAHSLARTPLFSSGRVVARGLGSLCVRYGRSGPAGSSIPFFCSVFRRREMAMLMVTTRLSRSQLCKKDERGPRRPQSLLIRCHLSRANNDHCFLDSLR